MSFREVITHSIPTDLEAAKALSSAPAALDLFMWISYRCFTALILLRSAHSIEDLHYAIQISMGQPF
jgi:hypothetical protein